MRQYDGSFRALIAWQEAKGLALEIYRLTTHFPKYEIYGLTSQLRRSASSVMANIAEGNERRTPKDRSNFFSIAKTSLSETDCFLELSYELKYISETTYSSILSQINRSAYLLRRLVLSIS